MKHLLSALFLTVSLCAFGAAEPEVSFSFEKGAGPDVPVPLLSGKGKAGLRPMILNNVSPVKVDEYKNEKTGEQRTFHFCELELTDGIDTVVAELAVPGVRDAAGQTTYPQPELPQGVVYGVAIELNGIRYERKDGTTGYMNRCRVRKIAKL